MRNAIMFIVIAAIFSCTSPDRARQTLEDYGFRSIEITGHAWNACSRDDSTCTGFTAVNARGAVVSGAVGCGYSVGCSKGCTIRMDGR